MSEKKMQLVTEPGDTEKGRIALKRRNNGDTFVPSFTSNEYQVEEVSFGKAAKILKRSKRRRSKTGLDAGSVSGKSQPARDVGEQRLPHGQDPGYEVEEIDIMNISSWMSEKEGTE